MVRVLQNCPCLRLQATGDLENLLIFREEVIWLASLASVA